MATKEVSVFHHGELGPEWNGLEDQYAGILIHPENPSLEIRLANLASFLRSVPKGNYAQIMTPDTVAEDLEEAIKLLFARKK